jgi:transmembrane sensor
MSRMRDDIATLIGKDLSHEISGEEKIVLLAWLNEHDENKQEYNQMKNLFDRTAALKDQQQFDADQAWVKVKARLHTKTQKPKTISWDVYWRVAAVLIMACSIGYLSYIQFFDSTESASIASAEVKLERALPDGTQVVLNRNSAVEYEFKAGEKKRTVKLKGEAFFEIAHQQEEKFILEVAGLMIEDIGTKFNVKAYPGYQFVEVFVEEGEVAFYSADQAGLRILAGETGIYDKLTKTFSKPANQDENVLAYKTGIFVFRDATLRTVIETLNEAYETKLKLENSQVENCRITVTFKNESMEVIADVLAETMRLSIEKSENEILLKGDECAKQ